MIENPEVKIRQAREVKRISQDFVATRLGASARAYSKIETDETQLTISRLNETCTILEVDPMKVLDFDGKKIFNISNSSTGICNGEYHLSQILKKLLLQYEETMQALKEQITLLKIMIHK